MQKFCCKSSSLTTKCLGIIVISLMGLSSPQAYAVPCPPIVANGIMVSQTGCEITTSTVNTPGILAQNLANVLLSNSSIVTTATASEGARVSNSTVTLNNVSISTSGNSNGIFITQGGHVVMNGGSITVGGVSAFGMQVVGTNSLADLDSVNIQVTASPGNAATGLLANNIGGAGIININNSNINVTGANATGVFANGAGSQVNLTNSSITANSTGSSGSGARALAGATLNIGNGSSITTTGNTAYGVFLDQTSLGNVNDTTINTSGNFAFGTYVQGGSTLNTDNVDITTAGNAAYGLIAINGAQANEDNTTIHTTGTNAFGVFLVTGTLGGSTVGMNNSLVETTGLDASAIALTISSGAPAGAINTLNATNTDFFATNAPLILADTGNANINFNNVVGFGLSGDFLFVDTANLNLVAVNSNLLGNTFVENGGNANIIFGNTQYTGAINSADIHSVDLLNGANSTWNMTANSSLDDLINVGSINYTPNGLNFKTLTVNGGYLGLNGSVTLNTLLEGDNSPSDLIVLNAADALGTTVLNIRNQFGNGALTLGNGILVVDALNGAITTPNAFVQNGEIVGGPFQYTLYRGGINGTDPNNWYLRSISPVITPTPTPSPTPTPGPIRIRHRYLLGVPAGYIPNVRPIVSLYTAIPSLQLLYDQMIFDTLHQRVGMEEQLINYPDLAQNPAFNGGWMRVIGENGERDNGGVLDDGPDFTYDFLSVQAGIDLYHQLHHDHSADFAGVFGMLGENSSDVDNIFGRKAGTDDFNSYTGGLYWTHFGSNGWYADSIAQTTFDRMTANNVSDNTNFHTNGTDWGLSEELGYPFHFVNSYTLEPQAQLSYQRLYTDNAQAIAVNVNFDNSNSLVGRLGAMFSKDWFLGGSPKIITAWVNVNILHQFQGNSTTLFSSSTGFIPFDSDLGGTWFDFGVGLNAQLGKYGAVFATYNRQQLTAGAGHGNEGVLGVRINV